MLQLSGATAAGVGVCFAGSTGCGWPARTTRRNGQISVPLKTFGLIDPLKRVERPRQAVSRP